MSGLRRLNLDLGDDLVEGIFLERANRFLAMVEVGEESNGPEVGEGAIEEDTPVVARGALLGLLVQSPSLMERVQQGAFVGYVIIAGALLGLLLVGERWLRLTRIQRSIDRQLSDLDSTRLDNPLGRILNAYDENQHLDDLETISRKLEVVVIEDVGEISKGLPVIKILATVAPLTGLLGTVVGMIETFQSITLFGTGDPKLMAGGISMALITTVLGLLAAIPLLISHTILSAKAAVLAKVVGEQAAGVMAQKAEQLAVSRVAGS